MSGPWPLVLLGAGGTAADVLEFLAAPELASRFRATAILDDDPALHGTALAGVPVEGPLDALGRWPDALVADTLGSPASFRRRPDTIASLNLPAQRYATIVHPSAVVADSATLGAGCIVYPHTMIGPQARLGEHVIVLSHSVVSHGGRVGDYAILASQVALGGRVSLGRCVYAGMGSTVIQDCVVGDEALLGMGAVVIDDVASGVTVAGNPARPIRSAEQTG